MKRILLMIIEVVISIMVVSDAFGDAKLLKLGPEEIVLANGVDIDVPGYSVPSFVDFNNDNLKDLVVGQGSGSFTPGKVRIYLNEGTPSDPYFSTYFYVQSNGSDLTCTASGCMGCFPRVVYWDADERKDLLIGQSDGTVKIFLNTGTDESPTFDSGTLLQVGQPGSKVNIDVGNRATPTVIDFNNDTKKDLVIGAYDARIHLFINQGTDANPDFRTETFAQANGFDLYVYGDRSSPVILDLDGDGKKDLLTGNTIGQLLFYSNVGTDAAPIFSDYSLVESNGIPIQLPSYPRSRPFVCDWTGDGYFDVLIGAGDGEVHLYQSIPLPGDMDKDYDVDFEDFALFALHWQQTNCGQCGGADITNNGDVDPNDLKEFAENWLTGVE